MFTADDIIYSYTRKQAIEDGQQALIYDDLRREAGIKYPVYLTSGVIAKIQAAVDNKKHLNDWEGVLWDMFTMFKYYAKGARGDTIRFRVIITGIGPGAKLYHDFIAQIGATDIDDPSPAITFMLPEEI